MMPSIARLRRLVDTRLEPHYVQVVASAVVAISLVIGLVQFSNLDQGQTRFGIPLGADFSGFFVAAKILNCGNAEQLYDRTLQHQFYHELFPREEERVSIPYVHPPFVAGLLRPIAYLPYPIGVAVWLVISAGLYLSATILLLNTIPWPVKEQRWLIVLLALSFEPFAFECWLGGQLSAIAFLSYALYFAAMRRSKPLWAGVALGLCFYKPTLLILILPLLVVGRRWKTLLGLSITGLVLGGLSVVFVGWDVSLSYVNELLLFRKSASGGDLEIRTWKYVDLNNGLRLFQGNGSFMQFPVATMMGILPFTALAWMWWQSHDSDDEFQWQLWAATLTWVPVLNVYVGIYDSILVFQSLLITSTIICLREKTPTPLTNSGFGYLMLLIYVAPWFSQNLAAITGVSVYTLILMGLGIYQLGFLYGMRRRMHQSSFPVFPA